MQLPLNYRKFFCFEDEELPKYWGNEAAGAIIIAKDTGRILLPKRSEKINYEPGTWGTWGGKIDAGETPKEAVAREIYEETGVDGVEKIYPLYTYTDEEFNYHNFLVLVPFEFAPKLNWENSTSTWVEYGEWPSPLHF